MGMMIRGNARLALAVSLSLLMMAGTSGCRKLGYDESPRTIPEDVPANLGPKRVPAAQQSESQNTSAATNAMAQGLISPDPAGQMVASAPPPVMQQPADSYGAYADNNFWANGAGWSNAPSSVPINAAPPSPQMPPQMMQQPQMAYAPPMQQPMMMQPPQYALPSLPAYNAPAPYQIPQQAMMQQPPMQIQQPSMQMPPMQSQMPSPYGAPQMAMNPPMDYPQLQEIPNQPFYRSNSEISADIADLQGQSQMAQMYQPNPWLSQAMPSSQLPPVQLTPPQAVQASPVGMDNSQYYGENYGQPPQAYSQPQQAYAQQQAPNPFGLPSAPLNAPVWDNSYPTASAQQSPMTAPMEAAFVPPAPVMGVAEAPAATQDWDRGAYGVGTGSQQAASGPLQLRMPNSPSFLPSSRYSGRKRGL
jgi:hypothetical protein